VQALQAGGIVIYDRYIPSSLAFMAIEAAAEGAAEQREEVYAAVKKTEYTDNQMPHEDLAIFLDVSPRDAIALLDKRKTSQQEDDEYTEQIVVQQKLYDEYDHLFGTETPGYLRIACLENNQLRTIEQIADSVWQAIIKRHPQLTKKLP